MTELNLQTVVTEAAILYLILIILVILILVIFQAPFTCEVL